MIPEAAVASQFVVHGGTGLRRLRAFETRPEAERYASDFDTACWNAGTPVPRSRVSEEAK